jgi:LuxR family maltose regulon positive regulatory protein
VAEPLATVAATSDRDVLLATKLHVPVPRPGFVPRPRLTDRLEVGLARGVELVCAPAGSGKTVLLSGWVRGGRRPVAWLSLDAGDNDPARFWRHAVAALDEVYPGIGERVGPLLRPPPSSFEGLVTAVINELDAEPDAGDVAPVLVLDDYHEVDSQSVHASLGFLLEHLPPRLHVVLASRADPPLSLARLRANGQLDELRAAELRFTAEEAAALLREAVGADVSDVAVAALAARTEGWAAGLQLAALSMRARPDVQGFVAAFTGSHRYVLDFLAEEVLERQTEDVRDFLLRTSVLERLSGPLCEAVTGHADSQVLLERIERAGLFVVPLDETRGWWRYHQLFADLLRVRLQEERPGLAVGLHRNAAVWYEQRGLADDAIRHAVAAGEMIWAARLAERFFDEDFYQRGEGATVQRRLAGLPAEPAGSRPRLLLARARLALLGGRLDEAERLLDGAERTFAEVADEPFEPSAGRAGSLLANVPAATALLRVYLAELRGDADGTVAFVSRAVAETREGDRMLDSITGWYVGMADWLRGRLPEAEQALSSTLTHPLEVGEGFVAAWGCHILGQVQRAQGRLESAQGTYHRTLSITALPGRSAAPAAGAAYVGLGEVAYQHGEIDQAMHHITAGLPLCRQLAYSPPLATGLITLAWIRQARGDPVGAREAIHEAGQAVPSPAVTGLLNPVPAQRARLLLVQGDLAAAARWTEDRGVTPDDEPDYPREPDYLVLARVLIAQGQAAQACALLARLRAAAADQGRIGSLIEVRALESLALSATGDHTGALAALTGALTLAFPRGYVRVFADEGPPMAALLRRLVAAQRSDPTASVVPPNWLAWIQRSFDHHPAPPDPGPATATPAGMVEPLTARELEVLELLAAGHSNHAIAGHLVVTVDTVKKHVSHVLDKVGATNRTEAVARARALSLIP